MDTLLHSDLENKQEGRVLIDVTMFLHETVEHCPLDRSLLSVSLCVFLLHWFLLLFDSLTWTQRCWPGTSGQDLCWGGQQVDVDRWSLVVLLKTTERGVRYPTLIKLLSVFSGPLVEGSFHLQTGARSMLKHMTERPSRVCWCTASQCGTKAAGFRTAEPITGFPLWRTSPRPATSAEPEPSPATPHSPATIFLNGCPLADF